MSDPITAASIATLIFTTAVSKLTQLATEDARKQLGQKLQTLKQLIGNRFQGKAKTALAKAEEGSKGDIETVANYLGVAMAEDDQFAQQVRNLAQEVQQIITINEVKGQNVQNVLGGEGNQFNNPTGTIISGGSNNTNNITIN